MCSQKLRASRQGPGVPRGLLRPYKSQPLLSFLTNVRTSPLFCVLYLHRADFFHQRAAPDSSECETCSSKRRLKRRRIGVFPLSSSIPFVISQQKKACL
jgi:hypothetical protein